MMESNGSQARALRLVAVLALLGVGVLTGCVGDGGSSWSGVGGGGATVQPPIGNGATWYPDGSYGVYLRNPYSFDVRVEFHEPLQGGRYLQGATVQRVSGRLVTGLRGVYWAHVIFYTPGRTYVGSLVINGPGTIQL